MKRKDKSKKLKNRRKAKKFSYTLTTQDVFDLLVDAVVAMRKQRAPLIALDLYNEVIDCAAQKDVVRLLRKVVPLFEAAVADLETLAEVRAHLAVISLVKKFPFKDGINEKEREQAAFDTWLACEAQCRATNDKFLAAETSGDYSSFDSRTLAILARARLIIDECLTSIGSLDDFVLYSIRNGRFGPGMTLCSKNNRETSAYHKLMQAEYSVTATCQPYFMAAISSNRRWLRMLVRRDRANPYKGKLSGAGLSTVYTRRAMKQVCASRLTFANKTALTKRPITIGPLGNVFIQLGADKWIKMCVKTYFGIDLTDNQMNRYLAWKGSRFGTTATVDSKSASDTIARELVRFLIRSDFYAFFDDMREKQATYHGKTYTLEKFSGMGNGYTFALESLIFAALTKACAEVNCDDEPFAIHGDDIACGRPTAWQIMNTFPDIGLTINVDKTFVDGPFREACGYDFWNGFNVRQYYLTEAKLTEPTLIAMYNGIQTTAFRNAKNATAHPWLMGRTLERLVLKLPRVFVGQAPDGNLYSNDSYGESRYLISPASPSAYGMRVPRYAAYVKPIKWNRDANRHVRWLLTLRDGSRYDVELRGVSRVAHRRAPVDHWSTPRAQYDHRVYAASEYFALSNFTRTMRGRS